jgi:hypothetical protein
LPAQRAFGAPKFQGSLRRSVELGQGHFRLKVDDMLNIELATFDQAGELLDPVDHMSQQGTNGEALESSSSLPTGGGDTGHRRPHYAKNESEQFKWMPGVGDIEAQLSEMVTELMMQSS